MLKNYTLITEKDMDIINLKSLCRFKFDVLKSQSKAKVQLVTCLDIVFPELANFLKGNLHIKSSYALLSKYPTAKTISKSRVNTLSNILKSASKGHFKENKATQLKKLASDSIGMDNPAIGTQIMNVKYLLGCKIKIYTSTLFFCIK